LAQFPGQESERTRAAIALISGGLEVGITGNLTDKAKRLGIPVLDHPEDGA
jgi:hypothetical protein